jgi:hypothetical protein
MSIMPWAHRDLEMEISSICGPHKPHLRVDLFATALIQINARAGQSL